MIRRDQGAVPGAAAAEHGQGKHASIISGRRRVSQIGNGIGARKRTRVIGWRAKPTRRKRQAPKSKLQRSTNIQTSNLEAWPWSLKFGASLELGAWNLELIGAARQSSYGATPAPAPSSRRNRGNEKRGFPQADAWH